MNYSVNNIGQYIAQKLDSYHNYIKKLKPNRPKT